MTPPAPVLVVLDIMVLVKAVVPDGGPDSILSPPPLSGQPNADAGGLVLSSGRFALCLSEHILANTFRVLTEEYGWSEERAEQYLDFLLDACDRIGGVYVGQGEGTANVSDSPDWEDNHILEAALEPALSASSPKTKTDCCASGDLGAIRAGAADHSPSRFRSSCSRRHRPRVSTSTRLLSQMDSRLLSQMDSQRRHTITPVGGERPQVVGAEQLPFAAALLAQDKPCPTPASRVPCLL